MPAVTTYLLHTVFNCKLRHHVGWGIAPPCLYCSYTGDNRSVSEYVGVFFLFGRFLQS